MLFTISEFLKDENDAIVTRSKDGKVIGTVVRLGELDANGLPIINHNGNISSVLFTVWQSPKQITIGQQVRGTLLNLPFEKADGEIINRNVIVAEGISYDHDEEKFIKDSTGEVIEEEVNGKTNGLISSYVKLKKYYLETATVETSAPSAPVRNKTSVKA